MIRRKKLLYLDPRTRKESRSVTPKFNEIDGTFLLINGRVIRDDELFEYCQGCWDTWSYSEEYDCLYCSNCNEWAEDICDDSECEFCLHRPIRPD